MVRASGISLLTTLAVAIVQVCVAAPVGLLADAGSSPADPDARRAITAMDLVTLKDIGGQYAAGLAVSPSSDKLAFQQRQASVGANGYRSAWLVAETTAGGRLTPVGDGGEPIFIMNVFGAPIGALSVELPKWSSDGQWIAYRLKKNNEIQIWRSRIDGAIQEQLTNNPGDVQSFVWSSDGSRLFFKVDRSRTLKAQIDKQEGERGYLFDGSFTPFYAPKPLWGSCTESQWDRMPVHRACSLSLWVFDLTTGQERKATSIEQRKYEALMSVADAPPVDLPQDRDIRSVYSTADGRQIAWLENENPEVYSGRLPPLSLVVASPGESRCPAQECRGYFLKVWWSANGDELYFIREEGVAYSTRAIYAWTPGDREVRAVLRPTGLISDCQALRDRAICLYEGPTSPRRIVVVNLIDGSMETLVDPNPEYRDIQFTEVRRLEWQDGFGNDTFGHLVYPAGYRQGQRYPLVVVQYRSRGFLRGGTGDEYPIHLLAARGFAVLSFDRPLDWHQMATIGSELDAEKRDWADLYERRRALTALETIIDRLDEEGIIDPDRVGITGLSDGAETLYFSLIHTDRFAAASASGGGWEQVMYYLSGEMFLRDYLPHIGLGRPGGPDDKYWADNAVSLNADKINAPLLMHVADHELVAAGIETFIALKEAEQPVEMFIFPDAHHIKWQPKHRFNIYRRNLQWFDFWLHGVEDPEPVDPEQYDRWRKLREQHDANQRAL